mmetsp:Transcript_33662/g.33931  ORF Transcript_33662/g.33931 Transcript_33662/m.33931 type:complete len:103 (-) Transcript_33662:291-599(-)
MGDDWGAPTRGSSNYGILFEHWFSQTEFLVAAFGNGRELVLGFLVKSQEHDGVAVDEYIVVLIPWPGVLLVVGFIPYALLAITFKAIAVVMILLAVGMLGRG